MTPAEFAAEVVAPTVREFLEVRGDRRRAYLACIAVYHLVDHIAHAESPVAPLKNEVRETVRQDAGPSFAIVQGVCNGTKHVQASGKVPFSPGDEIPAQRSYLVPRNGWFVGKLFPEPGEEHRFTPCLLVKHDGRHWEIDECVQRVFRAFVTTYPRHFAAVDRSFLDEQFRTAPPP